MLYFSSIADSCVWICVSPHCKGHHRCIHSITMPDQEATQSWPFPWYTLQTLHIKIKYLVRETTENFVFIKTNYYYVLRDCIFHIHVDKKSNWCALGWLSFQLVIAFNLLNWWSFKSCALSSRFASNLFQQFIPKFQKYCYHLFYQ